MRQPQMLAAIDRMRERAETAERELDDARAELEYLHATYRTCCIDRDEARAEICRLLALIERAPCAAPSDGQPACVKGSDICTCWLGTALAKHDSPTVSLSEPDDEMTTMLRMLCGEAADVLNGEDGQSDTLVDRLQAACEHDEARAEVERLREAAAWLARSEARYRHNHDTLGGSDIDTGRAWDSMRQAGDSVRAALAEHDSPAASPGEDGAPRP